MRDNDASAPRLRFAPSPTGRLHLGHALSALLNLAVARRLGGRLLVRIEDIDPTRCRSEFATALLEDLAWLGVTSDGPVLVQSEHLAIYRAAAQQLEAMGLLYPCFATRQEIQAATRPGAVDPDGAPLYPGLHKGLSSREIASRQAAGEPFAMRLDMAAAVRMAAERLRGHPMIFREFSDQPTPAIVAADPSRWGDVVIQRKDAPTSYHLAVVVDDARQGITHVVRGADLRASTDVHRLLQVLLGLPEPLYQHHRLLTDAEGRKLSKRDGDTGLHALRQRGLTVADIRRLVGLPDQ